MNEFEEFHFQEQQPASGLNLVFCSFVILIIICMFTCYHFVTAQRELNILQKEKQAEQAKARKGNEPRGNHPDISHMTIMNGSRDKTRSTSPISNWSNPYLDGLERGQTPARQASRAKSGVFKLNDSTGDTLKRPRPTDQLISLNSDPYELANRRPRVSEFQDYITHRSPSPILRQPVRSYSKESRIWGDKLGRNSDHFYFNN